jgi:parvulin-like peptidyl-prolyl isomerase
MNETSKSLTFFGVAVVCCVIAYLTAPETRDPDTHESRMGQALFERFDSSAATGIEIVEIDEVEGELKSIEVVKTEKGWFIRRPSRPDYPANADNQVKDVSTILFDLRIVDTASEAVGEHSKFGVVDPNLALPGDDGVGKMIALKDDSGSNLAKLIIGSEAEGLNNVRYVRKPHESTVFTAELQNVNDVSTKFVDWVEKDFLDLDKWNVKRVTLDNYEVNLAQGQLKRDTPAFVLDYDNSEWKLSGSSLSDKEELVKDKLDKMKDALDDLKIIDVQRKPEILVNNLKQGNEFFSNLKDAKNQAVVESLQQKGFYTVAVTNPAGQRVPKVVSNKGEILVGMKDGVEYVLRFGKTYRGPEDDENSTGDSRYIYAFARVNPSLLDPPALEPVPVPLNAPAPVAPQPDGNQSALGDSNSTQGEKGDEGKKGDASKPPAITPPSSPPPLPPAKESTAVEKNENAINPIDSFAKRKADRDGEIARIQAANAAKQREFKGKMDKAQKRVNELNENLAGWYYVISNEVYEKIRLERKDFVRVKEEDGKARPEEVKASHILISYKGADRADADIARSKEEAKAEAERIRKLIMDEGKDFAEMASEHSNGPSKTKGGDLGKFKFEAMAPSFSAAAFVLEVGTVSDVVETGFGFHVIKRTE